MHVLIDGEAVREDISDDDLERLAIASGLGETRAAVAEISDYLIETAKEYADGDEFEIDLDSIYTEITDAFSEWLAELSEDEKKELAEKIADAEEAA